MKMMKYKCLVLDHDDTAVSSTPCIHYPAFTKILQTIRPGVFYSQDDFLSRNFDPGLAKFYREELDFTDEEMALEFQIWRSFINSVIPPFFPGMPELIRRQKAEGGLVCVVSHSIPEYIRRDYLAAELPEPDLIYGWDSDRSKCKPSPYPLQEIMRITGLGPRDILMVDDLKPGLDMARGCGVDFAACGWGYEIPAIREQMMRSADYYLNSVSELSELLFPENGAGPEVPPKEDQK